MVRKAIETHTYTLETWLSLATTDTGAYRVEIEHHYDAIDGSALNGSLSGRSSVFTVQAEPRGEAVTLLEPHPGIGIHPGETIPFRWEISRDHIEAYGRVRSIRLVCYDADDETLSDLEEGVSVDTDLHTYDLPAPDGLPEGEYTAVIQVRFESGFYDRNVGASFNVLPPREPVVITYPMGGIYSCGERYPIRWDTIEGANAGHVRIELMKRHRVVETLTDMVPFHYERWDWDLEADCSGAVRHSGEGYRIRITHIGDDAITDTSDEFTIACPAIRLNRWSPRDGETWPLGGSRQILWTPDHMPVDATVRIELRRGPFIYTIARGVPANQDYFDWTVGEVMEGAAHPPTGEDYYIMILQEGCERVFGSSPEFTFE